MSVFALFLGIAPPRLGISFALNIGFGTLGAWGSVAVSKRGGTRCCGLVDGFAVSGKLMWLRYRFYVDAMHAHDVAAVAVDAHESCLRKKRHRKERTMFDADRSVGLARWDVVRLRANSKVQVILSSRTFFALGTHWVGHTVPCCGEQCQLCETLVCRGLFYAAVIGDGRQCMLELGALSATHLEEHCKLLHGGMRVGLVLDVWRRSAKSPVNSCVVGSRDGCREVASVDLAGHVMAVYKFPPPNFAEGVEDYEKRCRTISRIRNRQMSERLKASADRRV